MLSPELEAVHAAMMESLDSSRGGPNGQITAFQRVLDDAKNRGSTLAETDYDALVKTVRKAHDDGYRQWLEDLSTLKVTVGVPRIARVDSLPLNSIVKNCVRAGDFIVFPNISFFTASGSGLITHPDFFKKMTYKRSAYDKDAPDDGLLWCTFPALSAGVRTVIFNNKAALTSREVHLAGMVSYNGSWANGGGGLLLEPSVVKTIWSFLSGPAKQARSHLSDLSSRRQEIAKEASAAEPPGVKENVLVPFLEIMAAHGVDVDDPAFVMKFMKAFVRMPKAKVGDLRAIAYDNRQAVEEMDVDQAQKLVNLLTVKKVMES